MLRIDADINHVADGYSLLHWSVKLCNLQALKYLCEWRADINLPGNSPQELLACAQENLDLVATGQTQNARIIEYAHEIYDTISAYIIKIKIEEDLIRLHRCF